MLELLPKQIQVYVRFTLRGFGMVGYLASESSSRPKTFVSIFSIAIRNVIEKLGYI